MHFSIRYLGRTFCLALFFAVACVSNDQTERGIYERVFKPKIVRAFDEGANRELVLAVCRGDQSQIRSSASFVKNLNAHGRYGRTPIGWSLECGQKRSLQTLLELGADVNVEPIPSEIGNWTSQYTVLTAAAVRSDVGYLRLIFRAGYKIDNDRSFSFTLVNSLKSHRANSGNWDHLNLLLSEGLDPNATNPERFEQRHTILTIMSRSTFLCKTLELSELVDRVDYPEIVLKNTEEIPTNDLSNTQIKCRSQLISSLLRQLDN
ncbi:MAG: hypothetical protein AAGH90_07085 [Pseudomonadota bacterium]